MTMETYVSVDIETDGPIPGHNSMLSLGAAAFTSSGKSLTAFSVNLQQLFGSKPDPKTMEWWGTQPKAWAECRRDPVEPTDAMTRFCSWVENLPGKPVFVAYPAGFDFLFVYWYLIRYVGRSPFSFSALDMKSYAAALLGIPYRDATKKNFPKHWWTKVSTTHSHVALADAIEQGQLFCAMLADAKELLGALVQCQHPWHSTTAQANLLSNSFKCPVCADTEHPGWVSRK